MIIYFQMINLILQIAESEINYRSLLLYIFVYLGVLWFMFSAWVFVDAQKKFKNPFLSLFFAIIVFLLNFPALIFYLIVRPENENEVLVLDSASNNNSGINIPIINLKNGEETVLTFEVKLNQQALKPNLVVNVDVDDSLDAQSEVVAEQNIENISQNEINQKANVNIQKYFEKFILKSKAVFSNIQNYAQKIEKVDNSDNNDSKQSLQQTDSKASKVKQNIKSKKSQKRKSRSKRR
ncbi:MAG: hypothetical protein KatS3mg085_375 [Candidatus Dojkabacteria bacterium]|nr:MAG: hypothetical protein KatS3mg085_375 [Candidatus Dojkabacteria bacterium]